MGYCERSDIHSPGQTVREALVFSARLRMPPSVTNAQVSGRVMWESNGQVGSCLSLIWELM